jgi:hypothetical protein
LRRADRAPDSFECGRHVDMGDTARRERVDDSVRDGRECPTLPALPAPLTPNGLVLVGTGFPSMSKNGTSSVRGEAVIHRRAREELARSLVIAEMLGEGLADALRHRPLIWPASSAGC